MKSRNENIHLTGISCNPSDYLSKDGELAECVNLINESGELKPLIPVKQLFECFPNSELLYVHQVNGENYYLVKNVNLVRAIKGNPKLINGTCSVNYLDFEIYLDSGETINKVTSMGNTVVISTNKGLKYILLKDNTYKYIGDSMPELKLQFGLNGYRYFRREEASEGEIISPNEVTVSSVSEMIHCGSDSDTNNILQSTSVKSLELRKTDKMNELLTSSISAYIGEITEKYVRQKNRFMFPFYIRYAYRLYDGTLTRHSAPMLLIPTSNMGFQIYIRQVGGQTTSGEKFLNKIVFDAHYYTCDNIDYGLIDNIDFTNWKDIIKSVDFFISPAVTKYYIGESELYRCERIVEAEEEPAVFGIFSDVLYAKHTFRFLYSDVLKYPTNFTTSVNGKKLLIIPPSKTDKDYKRDLETPSMFYLIKSIDIDKLTLDVLKRDNLKLETGTLENLETKELMTDDYNSHDTIIADDMFIYNQRLNLTRLNSKLFNGFPLDGLGYYYRPTIYPSNEIRNDFSEYNVFTLINNSGKISCVASKHKSFRPTTSGFELIGYVYYPNPNAYKMIISKEINGITYYHTIALSEHPSLNGSYYFGNYEQLQWTAEKPAEIDEYIEYINYAIEDENGHIEYFWNMPKSKTDNTKNEPNKIYTSAVGNPYSFPVNGINSIGNGTIVGVSSATKALSQGQFGQFPLYVFATDGIWALEVDLSSGLYSSKHPIGRDVCINSNSITQIDGAVAFVSSRGLMLIEGSRVKCLSESLNGKLFKSTDLENIHRGLTELDTQIFTDTKGTTYSMKELINCVSDNNSFIDFIRDCKIAYDYSRNRLIIYRSDSLYQYVYSFKTGLFFKYFGGMTFNKTINVYPDTYIQRLGKSENISYGNIYNASYIEDINDISGKSYGFLVTRPIKFGSPDSIKSISRMLIKGMYGDNSFVKSAIYGSRDGENYFRLRSLRGIGWKFFRIVLYTGLEPTENLNRLSFTVDDRFNNKIR